MWYFAPGASGSVASWRNESIPMLEDPGHMLLRFAVPAPTGGVLMIVIGPVDLEAAQVSWRPSFPPDGTVVREFESLPLVDGAAAVALDSRPWGLIWVGASHPPYEYWALPLMPASGLSFWASQWPVLDPAVRPERGGDLDPDTVRGALGALLGRLSLSSPDEITPRVIWAGTLNGEPAALIHASWERGGDFRIMAVDRNVQTWVVPRGAPDFPAAWSTLMGPTSITVQALVGPDAAQVEFWRDSRLLLSDRAAPFEVRQFDVPFDGNDRGSGPTIVVRDAEGAVVWERPLEGLPGPNLGIG
jgi:hypothetical protein